MSKKTKFVSTLFLLLCLVLAAGCAPEQGSADYVDIDVTNAPGASDSGNPAIPGTSANPSIDPNAAPTPTPKYKPEDLDGTDETTPKPKLTYEQYQELNSDVVGWISIKDTKIDYPIAQGPDNEYYLSHSVEKEASKSGTVFLDARVNVGAKHMILFGHNMRNGTQFNGLNQYSQASFYENHREFSVTFGDTKYTYKVFAVYTVDKDAARYMGTQFADDETFATYMNELAELSKFDVDTTIKGDDHVITLSTCNRTDYSNGRFVVHAVQIS